MINEIKTKKYCCEDISLIENYELAISDTTQTWDCHHRRGIKEQNLREIGEYYNRPASELIFITHSEHISIHKKGIPTGLTGEKSSMFGKHHSEESKKKMSESHKGQIPWMKGKKHTLESKLKNSNAHKNKHMSEYVRQKMSESRTGKQWINDGTSCKQLSKDEELPEGWVFGRLFKNGKRNVSSETSKKMSESHIGKIWINNGITSRLISKNEELPEGWILGRTSKH